MLTLTCCQDHILTENIWFVCSETSYSGDERSCKPIRDKRPKDEKQWRLSYSANGSWGLSFAILASAVSILSPLECHMCVSIMTFLALSWEHSLCIRPGCVWFFFQPKMSPRRMLIILSEAVLLWQVPVCQLHCCHLLYWSGQCSWTGLLAPPSSKMSDGYNWCHLIQTHLRTSCQVRLGFSLGRVKNKLAKLGDAIAETINHSLID